MAIRFLPPSATPAARLILITRGVRAVADGCISVLLPAYLLALGFDGGEKSVHGAVKCIRLFQVNGVTTFG